MIKNLINKLNKGDNHLVFADPSNWNGKTDINGFFKVLEEMDKKGISAEITEINKKQERNEEFHRC